MNVPQFAVERTLIDKNAKNKTKNILQTQKNTLTHQTN